jgi:hypothetical protein
MRWKRVIGVVVAVMISVMVGALIYEAFDIHDTKPFGIDPEFPLMMLSSMLIFCVGIAVLIRRLFSFCLVLSEMLPLGLLGLSYGAWRQQETFERERLLFSPPLSATSLRI